MPRFKAENNVADLKLTVGYEKNATEQGWTPAQLALVWLLHKAPHIIAIAGTTNPSHIRENLAAQKVVLSAHMRAKLEAAINASNASSVQDLRCDAKS